MPSTIYAYVNGKFVPETEARVSIFDRGFLYGDGCFETMRVYHGRFFRALEHMDRLSEGLAALGIVPALSPEELRAVCRVLIQHNAVDDGLARVYVTRDSVSAICHPRQFLDREVKAMVSTVRVDRQLSRYKTANRLPYLLAQREAEQAGATEAILLNSDGHVVEGNTSNIFVVKDGRVVTPPLSDGPLPGIVRHAVVVLARELGIPVEERSFGPEFFATADEVFATNSLIEVAPVVPWGQQRVVTTRLQQAYRELVGSELNTPGP
jgi:branched-subunit amino acid aminotransferase/4-amino-4-deoxychorismate lyase